MIPFKMDWIPQFITFFFLIWISFFFFFFFFPLWKETEKAKEQIKKVLKVLNDYLQTRTYLVGERITQADITVACNMLQLYKYVSLQEKIFFIRLKSLFNFYFNYLIWLIWCQIFLFFHFHKLILIYSLYYLKE